MDISAAELKERIDKGESLHIIDVRNQLEFHTFNIGGTNIPLGKLTSTIEDLDFDSEDELILICAHGIRSKTAVQLLEQSGFTNVRNLKGGILSIKRLTN
ncbi:rhodanese-like domain-containing protein [Solitalea sp. MAHUQ-68]|uniref:Rhodanese-like domain-containing protein n=1 Tax=Solitalea agri TaxID=2953739 RepID=A0A9X2F580_9SPHI|nr:rhodanese-like domain-containing protein [Solitalea agri]MCO4294546.1 rhodanese-like domain-containing protein [Solitalea agri]